MKPQTEWTDEEFLGYCETHSQTDRALFSRYQIDRLRALAGLDPIKWALMDRQWIGLGHEIISPMVTSARQRLTDEPDRWAAFLKEAEGTFRRFARLKLVTRFSEAIAAPTWEMIKADGALLLVADAGKIALNVTPSATVVRWNVYVPVLESAAEGSPHRCGQVQVGSEGQEAAIEQAKKACASAAWGVFLDAFVFLLTTPEKP